MRELTIKVFLFIASGYNLVLQAENNFSNTLISNSCSLSLICNSRIQEENAFTGFSNNQFNFYSLNTGQGNFSHPVFSAGIYTLEFIGAGITPSIFTTCIFFGALMSESAEMKAFPVYSAIYLLSNVSISPLITAGIGNLFKQNGSYRNSIKGTLIGSVLGSIVLCVYLHRDGYDMSLSDFALMVVFPSAGCVIGYNFK